MAAVTGKVAGTGSARGKKKKVKVMKTMGRHDAHYRSGETGRREKVYKSEMMAVVSELLSVLEGKKVSLVDAESIAYLFHKEVEEKSATQLDYYKKTGTFRVEVEGGTEDEK